VPVEQISQSILVFRGHKVLLDEDLASLYGVTTSALVQAVKRNIGRFPDDFMFQLTPAEWAVLRSRIVIPTSSRGGRRFAPYVFTEQGVAMLSSVLGSERAIAINIEIMRAFVKLRDLRATGCARAGVQGDRDAGARGLAVIVATVRTSAGGQVRAPLGLPGGAL
jgi:ORF6N domain